MPDEKNILKAGLIFFSNSNFVVRIRKKSGNVDSSYYAQIKYRAELY